MTPAPQIRADELAAARRALGIEATEVEGQ